MKRFKKLGKKMEEKSLDVRKKRKNFLKKNSIPKNKRKNKENFWRIFFLITVTTTQFETLKQNVFYSNFISVITWILKKNYILCSFD